MLKRGMSGFEHGIYSVLSMAYFVGIEGMKRVFCTGYQIFLGRKYGSDAFSTSKIYFKTSPSFKVKW